MPSRGRRAAGGVGWRIPRTTLLVPGLAVFPAVAVMGALGGGFATATWCLAALLALALLVITLVVAPPPPAAGGRVWRATVVAYGAFCAWNYVSILWADVPGDAWEGANRTLLYGLVLVLVGLRPWTERAALLALGLLASGVGALALGVLIAGAAGDPAALFIDGRMAAPTGYANATAALWLIAFWPALHFASLPDRTLVWPLRALALAVAALLLQTSLLSQSRGAIAGFAVAALIYLSLTPHRRRAALALGLLFALTAAAWVPLTAVRTASATAGIVGPLADARGVIVLSVLIAFAAGAGAAGVEVWLREPAQRLLADKPIVARAGRLARGAAGAAVVALLAWLMAFGHPVGWTMDRWQDFKTSGYELETRETRFTGSLGSNRYDFYRVALGEFRAHPMLGIGSDNFAVPYLIERRSDEAPRYPHSLAFRLLAQLGVAGVVLFAAFLTFAISSARRARRASPAHAGVVAAALAGFGMWLAHGMVDWLWEFPALSISAFALLALAARLQGDDVPPATAPRGPSRLRAGMLALVALVVAVSLALPGTAARYTVASRDATALNPVRAIGQLHRAAQLNFLSARPLIAEAVTARQAGDAGLARTALQEALQREPRNWFAHLELALLDARDGRRASAMRSLSAAIALNPRQPVLTDLRRRLRRGDPIDASAVEASLSRQLAFKLRPAGELRRTP